MMKRGRGRPRKDGCYPINNTVSGSRLDPTSEHFLRNEHRDGGPTDPFYSFLDNVQLLFKDKFENP
jgi:hypothetical protein